MSRVENVRKALVSEGFVGFVGFVEFRFFRIMVLDLGIIKGIFDEKRACNRSRVCGT